MNKIVNKIIEGRLDITKGNTPSISSNSDSTLQSSLSEPNTPTAVALSGKEKLVKTYGDIEKYKGDFGSFRYIERDKGIIIAAIKIVTKGKTSILSTIYVDSMYRNKGIASKILDIVKKDFPKLEVDNHLTKDGAKFFGIAESIQDIKDKYKDSLEDLYITKDDKRKQLKLSSIKVKKGSRDLGIGTNVMKDIISYADSLGYTITLIPSKDYGASSVSRLKVFYKRLGFLENKGRNADYTISYSMYKLPKNNATEGKFMKNISILESLRNSRKLTTINETYEDVAKVVTLIKNAYSTLEPNVKPPNLDADLEFISSSVKNIEELVQDIATELDYTKRTDKVRMSYNLADKSFQIAHALYHNITGIQNGIQMGNCLSYGNQAMMDMSPIDNGIDPIVNMIHSLKEYLKQTMTILAQNM